jgi:NADH dehydrogenase FAD-containing subunit
MSFIKSWTLEMAAKYELVLVSPRNYFVYTPLLPAMCAGTVEERSIVEPVRAVLGRKGKFYEAKVTEILPEERSIVACFPEDAGFPEACFKVPYDVLVLACGCVNNTFGIQGVQEHTSFFKSVEDASRLRLRVSECFERAALPQTTAEERRQLLSFVIVGGGPTGVEVAAELHDLINDDLAKLYPDEVSAADTPGGGAQFQLPGWSLGPWHAASLCRKRGCARRASWRPHVARSCASRALAAGAPAVDVRPPPRRPRPPCLTLPSPPPPPSPPSSPQVGDVRIRVVELMDHVLSTYDRAIGRYTAEVFKRNGIDLVLNSRVSQVSRDRVTVVDKAGVKEELPFGACVWATGGWRPRAARAGRPSCCSRRSRSCWPSAGIPPAFPRRLPLHPPANQPLSAPTHQPTNQPLPALPRCRHRHAPAHPPAAGAAPRGRAVALPLRGHRRVSPRARRPRRLHLCAR